MPIVPAGITAAWPSTNGTVPSGWERDPALDDRYPKGAAASADPGVQGGASTHGHTSPAHGHTVASHNHGTGTLGAASGTTVDTAASDYTIASNGHTHSGGTSGSTTATLTSLAGTVDAPLFTSVSNELPRTTVIWIRSLGTATGFPAGAWTYWDGTGGAPSGWSVPTAPKDHYLKGAVAGGDGGTTTGTLASHFHGGIAHTHPFGAHSHTGTTTTSISGTVGASGSGSTAYSQATDSHTHAVSFGAVVTAGSGSQASGNTGSTTAEPAYVKLAVIQNDNGAADYPIGAIGVWTGLLSAVPAGYVVCDGSGGTVDTRGKFVKVADALGNIGGTGGSTTHDHTDPSAHTHTTAHQHATLTGAASAFVTGFVDGTGTVGITNAHVHAGTSAASSASASGNGTQTVDAAAHDPPHLTVVHVKYTGAMSVNITSPTEGQTVSNPGLTVTWTLSDSVSGVQATRRVRVYAANQSTLVHDSGTAATSSLSYALPTTIGLSNLTTYYVRVDGTDTNGLPGISAFVGFVTSWTAPGTVGGLTLTPIGGV